MLYPNIWDIIADYAAPDVNISEIYLMDWPIDMFFCMELSGLHDIIKNLNPLTVKNITRYIRTSQIGSICDITGMDRSRSLAPNIVDIHRIIYEVLERSGSYTCYCCHHSDSNYIYNHDTINESELSGSVEYDRKRHARWTTRNIVRCNISYLSQCCYDIDQFLDLFGCVIDYKSLSENINIGNNLESLMKRVGDKLCWNSICKNESIPVSVIRSLLPIIDNNIIANRIDQQNIDVLLNTNTFIDSKLLDRQDISLTKIITNYYHKLTPYHLQCICSNPNAPFELLFQKLPDRQFLYGICSNPNVPFDMLFDKFEHHINWNDICSNPNIPTYMFTDKYLNNLNQNTLARNECLPFGKVIKCFPDIPNKFINYANRGYYTYLVKQALMIVLCNL